MTLTREGGCVAGSQVCQTPGSQAGRFGLRLGAARDMGQASQRRTMKHLLAALMLTLVAASSPAADEKTVSLFDGKTFAGWEGDTNKTWRIEACAFVGGSLKEKVPRN